ncbi:hypothetical protein STAS_13294 [Striga asiatica]|uniref:Uncharacterized protein n=1 Tax=Striga asiatica TaxID=4170 RepID=A0A5A7PWL2_STRAF|nr:hypothetical protein STAS_13294 [Striga asiatica]
MATLKDGALLKLLDDMKSDVDDAVLDGEPPKPVLLQIRSIIPVLEEGDLWPNRGFFLKVADSTHALYVSLSEEQNEMILGNKLKLGQYIYVQRLRKSHPVPLLEGVSPIPGRRACEGTPEDIILSADFSKVLEASSVDSEVEKGVILEKKVSKKLPSSRIKTRGGASDSESSRKKNEGLKYRSSSASKARPGEIAADNKYGFTDNEFKKIGFSDVGLWPRSRASSVDNDSDGDSVISSCSSHVSKRRSWLESEILGVKEIFDSTVVRHDIKFPPRSRSANVSPVRSVKYDSSDDNLSSVSRRRSIGSAKRVIKSSNKSQVPVPKAGNNVQNPNSLCGLVYERKGAESGISWSSLPSNLVKLGKEVARQRDNALLAASDALQEACASERLLNSLSTFSQFPLAEGEDLQPHVDRFFKLQHELARTALIMQSLTTTSPFGPGPQPEENDNIALERKNKAMTWLKSAVALDLSTGGTPKKRTSSPLKYSESSKKFGSCAELAMCLQEECRKLFLGYVERYLEEVERKIIVEDDAEVAGMMYKVKMVSDWLDLIGSEGGGAHERVRAKIYGILLSNVERTAVVFERAKGTF